MRARARPRRAPAPRPSAPAATAAESSAAPAAALGAADAAGGAADADSAEGVIAAIRRERLVDVDPSALAPDVRAARCAAGELAAAAERLASDLYEKETSFVSELIQNADDARFAPSVEPELELSLVADGVGGAPAASWFFAASNEAGFTRADVQGVCDLNKSTKRLRDDATGHKGIGFKAVFLASARPHVLSGSYAFSFDAATPLGLVTPTWLRADDARALPPAALANGAPRSRTAVLLPLREGTAPIAAALGVVAAARCSSSDGCGASSSASTATKRARARCGRARRGRARARRRRAAARRRSSRRRTRLARRREARVRERAALPSHARGPADRRAAVLRLYDPGDGVVASRAAPAPRPPRTSSCATTSRRASSRRARRRRDPPARARFIDGQRTDG